jgi:hypothetical protein
VDKSLKNFLKLKIDGKEYSTEKDNSIVADFDKNSKIEAEGGGNGLLALARSMNNLYKFIDEWDFDKDNKNFKGKILIKLGVKRKGTYLGVCYDDTPTEVRSSIPGYVETYKMFESFIGEAKKAGTSDPSDLAVLGDDLADAIRAAHYVYCGAKWVSNHGPYSGFKEMMAHEDKTEIEYKGETEEEKNLERAVYLLSVSFHYLLNWDSILFSDSKLDQTDFDPIAREILKGQPLLKKNPKYNAFTTEELRKFNPAPIKKGIYDLLNSVKPLPTDENVKAKPIFIPVLDEYYKFLTECVVKRVLLTYPSTYDNSSKNVSAGEKANTKSSSGSKETTYQSGKAN